MKKFSALFLTFAMLLSMLTFPAMASGEQGEVQQNGEASQQSGEAQQQSGE